MDQDALKKNVAQAALEYVENDSVVGIGTGSTTNYFIDALAASKRYVKGAVSSSVASENRLKRHHIPVFQMNEVAPIDLYVDGCDESDSDLNLIKGGGGALTREKIVCANATRFVCIADESKYVEQLGEFPLPIEVIPMARSYVAKEIIKRFGGEPVWREDFVTDNGNHILDVHLLSIDQPKALESALNEIVGVVCNGLFAQRGADVLLISSATGIQTFTAKH